MFELKEKNCIVTGGASGIGLEFVKIFLKYESTKVAIFDWNSQQGENVVSEFKKEVGNERIIFLKVNVVDSESFEEAFKDTFNKFKRIDILVNNAGIFNDKKWELEININLIGNFRGNLLGLKYMGRDEGHEGGVIVNIASIAGIHAKGFFPGYTASKYGVVGASQSFGAKCNYDRTGVRVLVLCPGPTGTPLLRSVTNIDTVMCQYLSPAYQSEFLNRKPRIDQRVEHVADTIIEMIKKADTGSVWVVKDNLPPFEYKNNEQEVSL